MRYINSLLLTYLLTQFMHQMARHAQSILEPYRIVWYRNILCSIVSCLLFSPIAVSCRHYAFKLKLKTNLYSAINSGDLEVLMCELAEALHNQYDQYNWRRVSDKIALCEPIIGQLSDASPHVSGVLHCLGEHEF